LLDVSAGLIVPYRSSVRLPIFADHIILWLPAVKPTLIEHNASRDFHNQEKCAKIGAKNLGNCPESGQSDQLEPTRRFRSAFKPSVDT
jgi:hypothetical protein